MPKVDSDFKDIFYPLNELLEDMCNFLYDERLTKMSENDKTMAESIITRSRVQLKALSKFKPLVESNEEYIVMNKDEDANQGGYSSLPEYVSHTSLSVRDVGKDEKCGYIYMKRRFLLGFGKMYRVYAVINTKYLLIYNSENDCNPIHMINLLCHHIKYNCERNSTFMLIGSDSKTYQFQASNGEEMLTWVTKLNKCRLRKKRRNKATTNTLRPVSEPEKVDARFMRDSFQQIEENIYEDIYKGKASEDKNNETYYAEKKKVPPLPIRTILRSKPTPVTSCRSLPLPEYSSDQHLEKITTLDSNKHSHYPGHSSLNIRLADNEDIYEEVDDFRIEKETGDSRNLETTVPPILTLRTRVTQKPPILRKPTNLRTSRRIQLV